MTFSLTHELRSAIEAHARAEYPKECCGFISKGVYTPCVNVAPDPLVDFQITDPTFISSYVAGEIEAIVHSHPNADPAPTASDMAGQIDSGVPWIIVGLNEDHVSEPVIWGDDVAIPPVIGRQFMHGVTDCYALIRDVYRLGKGALAKEGVDWPFEPIELPDFPRDDVWWADGKNLYVENFAEAGFYQIKREEAQAGDVFLCKVRSPVLNHGGVVVGGGLILHHLPNRLSRREPAGIWQKSIEMWLRHKDAVHAA